jgi:hypothetical protein
LSEFHDLVCLRPVWSLRWTQTFLGTFTDREDLENSDAVGNLEHLIKNAEGLACALFFVQPFALCALSLRHSKPFLIPQRHLAGLELLEPLG